MLTSPGAPQPLDDPESPPTAEDLQPTAFLNGDDDAVRDFVARVTAGAEDEHDVAARLFAAVRDEVRYDPYRIPTDPADYRASAVLGAGSGYCVQKAVALTAAARAAGIPSRLGFADVRNHLQSERLRGLMGTDLFVWHGYSTLFVGGRWTKASPAFNAELCARFGVPPLDFDGTQTRCCTRSPGTARSTWSTCTSTASTPICRSSGSWPPTVRPTPPWPRRDRASAAEA